MKNKRVRGLYDVYKSSCSADIGLIGLAVMVSLDLMTDKICF